MIDRSGQITAGVHQSAVKVEADYVERKFQAKLSNYLCVSIGFNMNGL
jgi:hypothetical protein